jgi:secretion/DNA translocation related TadE-like protein
VSRRRWPTPPQEDGFAVPVALGLGGVLVSLALAGAAGGQVLVAQRRAAAAADLAALAGAVAGQHGQEPCPAARRMAGLGEATLASCAVDGERVRVVTAVELRIAGHDLTVRARAHAGPREGR